MASSIPATHTALTGLLEALTSTGQPLDGVRVEPFGAWREGSEHDLIVVSDPEDIDRQWPGVGATQFKETYTIPVLIQATMSGNHLVEVGARAWELTTIVEQTVIANHQLDGQVIYMLPKGFGGEGNGQTTSPADSNSCFSRLTLNVECQAVVNLAS